MLDRRFMTWSLVGALFAGAPAFAAEPMRLTLAQALDVALQRNVQLRVAGAELARAGAAQAQSDAALAPRVSLQAGATRSNDALTVLGMKLSQRSATFNDFGAGQFLQALNAGASPLGVAPDNLNRPDAANDFHGGLQVEFPLYTGGRIDGLRKQASEQLAAARAGDAEARQKVVEQVVQGFDAVVSAQAFVGVAQQSLQAAQTEFDTAQRLWRAGVVVRSDVLSAQLGLEQAKLQRAQADDTQQQALDQLRVALGVPQDTALQLEGTVEVPLPAGRVEEWTQQALGTNPGIEVLRHQLRAAGGGVQAARSQLRPQIGAVARIDTHDAHPGFAANAYTIGAQLQWTLFDGGVARAGVDQALAERMRAQAQLDAAEQQLGARIRQAWRDSEQAELASQTQALAVQQAQEAERIVRRRYGDGVGTLVEWQQAQARLDRARAELLLARHRVQVQRAALRLALGRLQPADVISGSAGSGAHADSAMPASSATPPASAAASVAPASVPAAASSPRP